MKRMKYLLLGLLSMSIGTINAQINLSDVDTIECKENIVEKPEWFKYLPQFKGTFRARYELSPNIGESRFQLRNARVGILGDVSEVVSYKAEIDFCDQGDILVADAYTKLAFENKQYAVTAGFMRLPISMDANRGPSNYLFANRSFVCKYVGNVRDVGVKLGYHPTKLPLNIEAGIFNGSEGEYTKNAWFKTFIYVARANYTCNGLKAEVSLLSQKPTDVRMNSFDFALSWNYDNFFLEAEYMNKHYTNDAFKTVHTYNIMGYYKIPFKKVFSHILIQARWDSMTDYWNGKCVEDDNGNIVRTTILPGRNRLTTGVTLAYIKKIGAEFRINYEKYFYHDNTNPYISEYEKEKVLAEFIVKF